VPVRAVVVVVLATTGARALARATTVGRVGITGRVVAAADGARVHAHGQAATPVPLAVTGRTGDVQVYGRWRPRGGVHLLLGVHKHGAGVVGQIGQAGGAHTPCCAALFGHSSTVTTSRWRQGLPAGVLALVLLGIADIRVAGGGVGGPDADGNLAAVLAVSGHVGHIDRGDGALRVHVVGMGQDDVCVGGRRFVGVDNGNRVSVGHGGH